LGYQDYVAIKILKKSFLKKKRDFVVDESTGSIIELNILINLINNKRTGCAQCTNGRYSRDNYNEKNESSQLYKINGSHRWLLFKI
jgi:hypothetical protein